MGLWQKLEEHEEFDYIYLSLNYITDYEEDKSMIIGERLRKEGFEQGIMEEKMLIARNLFAANIPVKL